MHPRSATMVLAATLLAAAGLGCAKPASVTVEPKKLVLRESNGTKQLVATVFNAKGNPMPKAKVVWTSSAPDVASVDAAGMLSAKGTGDAVITAAAGQVTGRMEVKVRLLSSLTLKAPDTGVQGPAGTVVPLAIHGVNEKGEDADMEGLALKSSAPAVATVDAKGGLTILATGNTEVSASLGKVSTTIPVTVRVETPAAVKVESPAQSVKVGETQPLAFSVISDLGRPMDFPATLTSSSEKVATVDGKGNVTGVARGTSVITIQAATATNTIKVVVR